MLWAVKNAWKELQRGVTVIRDCGSKNRVSVDLRNSIKEGIINGPRVFACGFGIAATGGHETHKYQGAVEADGPDEIRKAVRAEIKAGADFIKFMGSGGIGGMPENEDPSWVEMGVDELEAGIREAHYRGKRTTVHAMSEEAILNALKAGIDCIEHGVMLNEQALDIMAVRGVYYVPTISGIAAAANREAESGKKEIAEIICNVVVEPLKSSIKRAYARGITIGCGTDTLGDVVDELKILNSCGLPGMECIRAATINAAKICGIEDKAGSVEAGKIADLLIVEGDPLEDIEALRKVRGVLKAGTPVNFQWLINQ
jgi:imidazolonepropionase-like amidohydrolase